jgi:hypothetical protein
LDLLNGGQATEFPAWEGGCMEFDLKQMPFKHLFMRDQAVAGDIKTFDFGFLSIAYSGITDAGNTAFHDVFMEYVVELSSPTMPDVQKRVPIHSSAKFGNSDLEVYTPGQHIRWETKIHDDIDVEFIEGSYNTTFRLPVTGLYALKYGFITGVSVPAATLMYSLVEKNGVAYSIPGQHATCEATTLEPGGIGDISPDKRAKGSWKTIVSEVGDEWRCLVGIAATSVSLVADTAQLFIKFIRNLSPLEVQERVALERRPQPYLAVANEMLDMVRVPRPDTSDHARIDPRTVYRQMDLPRC